MEAAVLPRQAQQLQDEADEIARLIEEEVNPPVEPVEPDPPVVAAVEPDPPAPDPEPPAPDPEPDWKGKYDTLQGKYDIEVPRLHQLNGDLQTQMQTLSDQVEALTEQLKTPAPPATPAPSSITEKDEEAFGSDLIDLNRRVVAEALAKVQPTLDRLETENTNLKTQLESLGSRTERTSAELFNDRLTEAVPTWREVDTQRGWLDWLTTIDPLSGLTRQTYLRNAITQMDVKRTASIFKAYMALSAPPPPPTDETPAPSPADELASQITPSRSAAPASVEQVVDPAKRIWTGRDVEIALDPRRLRKMTDAEQAAVFSEIDAAQAEGRVVP
jgi:hypothetical protein